MLNPDALAQLSQLKQSIQDSRDIADGTVRGTNNRFGFVSLDDGREAFLAPDTMNQVLPGDRVKVEITTNDKNKLDARLEKLLSTELKTFVGRYIEKGKNHFVAADAPQLSRWFFVPPKERKKFKHDDLVACQITRHPFGDGKAQVKITAPIGHINDPGIERNFLIAKFELATEWPQAALEQAAQIQTSTADSLALPEGYEDLRHLTFVTIDAETTQDMDDALFAEKNTDNWILYTAIADPSAHIPLNSPLDISARQRACSAYLTGGTLNMLPKELSEGTFSLHPNQDRLALVCKMTINPVGVIEDFSFIPAMIKSHHKLSYNAVAAFLADTNSTACEFDDSTKQLLSVLFEIANNRLAYRRAHCIVQEDNVDYFYTLNDQQKIESISKRNTTLAHQIVEESMLATNTCAGAFLSAGEPSGDATRSTIKGLFSAHAGFRTERLQEIEQWLKKDKPELDHGDLTSLDNFVKLIRGLQQDNDDSIMLATLKRLLQASEISATVAPHYGLGFSHYAMTTSPIRRYQDLYNHRLIKALLTKEAITEEDPQLPLELQMQLSKVRQVNRQLDQWLLRQYLNDKNGEEFTARVMAVSNQGIAVRMEDSGAEGFIPLRGTKEEPSKYDSIRMRLTHENTTYHIEQPVKVRLVKVDHEQQQLNLALVIDAAPDQDAKQDQQPKQEAVVETSPQP